MSNHLTEFAAFAEHLADLARPIARQYFRKVGFEDKADGTPVTIADREIEQAIRTAIEQTYPQHGILGEEWGSRDIDAEWVWVIDPIDGTKSFTIGRPIFGTLISLAQQSRPVIGVIDQPILSERWVGAAGETSRFNGAPIRTRGHATLADAILATTMPEQFQGEDSARFATLKSTVRGTVYGGDCYLYGLLASGHLDLVVERGLKPFDYCALVPVIEGAGGVITDWQGAPLTLESDGGVIAAANAALAQQVRETMGLA